MTASPAGARRLAVLALVASLAPVVVGLVAVRPVAAQETLPGFATYGLTGLAAGVRTAGDVGASGGLVTLDTGSGQVAARLDSSPSAGVLAAPYEPGTLFRTVVGQGNAGAGETVLDVPDAEAAFPGTGSGAVALVPSSSGGPVSGAGGSAVAEATATSAKGSATGSALAVEGAFTAEGSTSLVTLQVDPDKGTTSATGRTALGRLEVAGVLELRDVVATAAITSRGDTRTTAASLTVGGATVAGMPVALTDGGVEALGTTLLPGQTVRDRTAAANAALAMAGITVRTLEAVQRSDRRSASVDTGGVVLTLATPGLPGGVAANRLEIVVGGVALTEVDERAVAEVALPALPPVPVAPPPPPTGGVPIPGTPAVPGIPAQPGVLLPAPVAPPVAAPAVASPTGATILVAGRRIPAAAALAGFAAWQFLSLSTATLYAFVERRRRLALREISA